MRIWTVLLIGLSTNLDNFCMAALLGMQRRRIPLLKNLVIALISGAVSFIASEAASFLIFTSFAALLGGILIIGMGVYTISSTFFQKEEQAVDIQELGLKQTGFIGMALSLNCLPVAFGAGAMGHSPLLVSVFIAFFSFLCMEAGARLGCHIGGRISAKWLNALSGALLIVLGLFAFL